ncbi:MAG: RNA polymerase sigma factor [Cyclobacteriaceae bacterium]|nr:RNA polymerase sigma factor [Cyclobacteriaceae bacterium]
MISEQALLEGCCNNDRASQRALYDRYARKMFAVCQRYTRTGEEAEDVLQEGFVKVFAKLKTFRGEAKLETWLTRIFINASLNHQRQKLYLFPMVDVETVPLVQHEQFSLANLHLEELLKMIKTLPDGCRVVFNLFAIEGYGHKEIAELLGISEGTSKSQYNRARQLLQEKLMRYERDYETYRKTTL